jgi:Tat protein secretion system quality control protein TatD with DNase activity
MCTADKARRQGRDAVRAVPIQRLLVESDVHAPSDVLGGTMGAAAYVAAIRDESIAITVRATTQNALRFCKSICPTNKRNSMIDASY